MHRIKIEFDVPSKELAESLAFSISHNKKVNRGKVVIIPEGNTLKLEFYAHDLTALRAALNTHLRILDMLINSWEVVENGRRRVS